MNEVVVKKERLLETLKTNREDHRKDFEISWEAFRKKAIENFEERLRAVKEADKGTQINLHIGLRVPEDHTDDYDRAIEMLDWEVGDEITLQQHEFAQLVQDNWGWKAQVSATNMAYTGSPSPSKGSIG